MVTYSAISPRWLSAPHLPHVMFNLLHIFFSQMFLWIPREGSRKVTTCVEDTDVFRECVLLTSREAIPMCSHPRFIHFPADSRPSVVKKGGFICSPRSPLDC